MLNAGRSGPNRDGPERVVLHMWRATRLLSFAAMLAVAAAVAAACSSTERRWAELAQHDQQPGGLSSSGPGPVVDPCGLVATETVAELGVTTPPRPLGEAPDDAIRKGLDCLWGSPDTRLVVTVVAFADRAGHDAVGGADLHVEQWATSWQARKLSGLGDRAAVVTDDHAAVVWTVHGTSAIKVEFRSESLSPAELEATAERVTHEVLANLPY